MQGDFREPLLMDEAGFYITVAQMQFFLNREDGQQKFEEGSEEFSRYYLNCCMYNSIYDLTEKDPDCAKIYWDDNMGCVSVTFPMNGVVSDRLAFLNQDEEYDEDADDEWGIFE